jgi:ribosomal-protein-alanine N-acetyltransferase
MLSHEMSPQRIGILMDSIETDRLLLRPFKREDGPSLHAVIGNDPDMIWESTAFSPETTEEMLTLRLKHYEKYGFGVWAVIDKVTGEMIGQTGLQVQGSSWKNSEESQSRDPKNTQPGTDIEDIEIVVYTAKRRWHQGIGFEACTAALLYGFGELNLHKITAITRADNIAGQKLAEKLGFRLARKGVAYGFDVFYYELLRTEFVPKYDLYKVHRNV